MPKERGLRELSLFIAGKTKTKPLQPSTSPLSTCSTRTFSLTPPVCAVALLVLPHWMEIQSVRPGSTGLHFVHGSPTLHTSVGPTIDVGLCFLRISRKLGSFLEEESESIPLGRLVGPRRPHFFRTVRMDMAMTRRRCTIHNGPNRHRFIFAYDYQGYSPSCHEVPLFPLLVCQSGLTASPSLTAPCAVHCPGADSPMQEMRRRIHL